YFLAGAATGQSERRRPGIVPSVVPRTGGRAHDRANGLGASWGRAKRTGAGRRRWVTTPLEGPGRAPRLIQCGAAAVCFPVRDAGECRVAWPAMKSQVAATNCLTRPEKPLR